VMTITTVVHDGYAMEMEYIGNDIPSVIPYE